MAATHGASSPWPPLLLANYCQLGFLLVLQLLSLRIGFVTCQTTRNETNGMIRFYFDFELDGLQKLWNEWNKSTPDLSSNLAGWSSSQKLPCESDLGYWKGVTCIRPFCENIPGIGCNESVFQGMVIGLSLSNASIVGTLPDVFWYSSLSYLPFLSTLELTGNPGLSGPLPAKMNDSKLYVLDLHDNAFNGTISNDLIFPQTLDYLDLSGNQITGTYPVQQMSKLGNSLRTFNIGRNYFSGLVPIDAFRNETKLQIIDISRNNFTGPLPDLSFNTELQYLDVSGNQFEGLLPNLTQFAGLRHVNLGGNHFTGTLKNLSDIVNVNAVTLVDISNNELEPEPFLPNLKASDLGSIQELYLDGNNITGTLDIAHIFSELANYNASTLNPIVLSVMNNRIVDVNYVTDNIEIMSTNFMVIKLQGNPYCEVDDVSTNDAKRCFCKQICYITPVNKTASRKIIIIAVTSSTAAVALIVLVLVGAFLFKTRRYKRYLKIKFQQKFEEFNVKPTIYSYNELKAATRDFHAENKLGQGGYGAVYKGVLANGSVVAVKQLFVKTSQTGLDDFSNEVVLITGMKHRNLVNLKGCCFREGSRILVYEYVDNYDVHQILLGTGPERQVVPWPSRVSICLGIAHGLHYLHALAHPRVIHRDIKASNILLDKNLEPKVADFGLALLFPDEESHLMTIHVAGTKGYLAPEYATLGKLSDKVDVYSFGVVCLEIISGRRNIDESLPLEQVYLTPWAWKLHAANKLIDLVDPALQVSDADEAEDVQRVIKIALMCTQEASDKRPTMARIVSLLQRDTQSDVELEQFQFPTTRTTSSLTAVTEEGWSTSFCFSSECQHILRDNSNTCADISLREIRSR